MCCACAGTCNHVGNHWYCAAHGGTATVGTTTTRTFVTTWPTPDGDDAELDMTEAEFDRLFAEGEPVKITTVPHWCRSPLLRGYVMANAIAAPLILLWMLVR